jgi:cytoplasmic iron level regulating protein YaaA (DUF328/UPF0246 family)
MSPRVVLVSCVKSKQATPTAAADLYTSPLFCSFRRYAEANADSWYILSAEHGLLRPNQVVAPYERTLNKMLKADRTAWAKRVQQQLLQVLPSGAEVVVLAGERYREGVVPFLREHGFPVKIPLQGLSFGRQRQRLNEMEARGYAEG